MIPDFPTEKQQLLLFWNQYLDKRINELSGPLQLAQSYRHYEGDRWLITRDDNSSKESNYSEVASIMNVSLDEVPTLTSEKIKNKLDIVAEEMSNQMLRDVLGEIAQAAESIGNVFTAKGEAFTSDQYLKVLDSMDQQFSDDGSWIKPIMFVTQEFLNKNKEKIEEFNKDPEYRKKLDQIINKKREEWHAREACRKLVD